jgi:predicted transcriptional regulator
LFRKPIKIILAIIKCWAAQLTITKTRSVIELNLNHKVTEPMVAGLFSRLRQLCSLGIDKPNLKLGGKGRIVEIDESMYCKVKHHKG